MHIAIDALGIHYFGGGRTVTLTLLDGLFNLDQQNQYQVYLSQAEPSLDRFKANVRQVVLPIKNRFLLRLYAQLVFPFQLGKFDLIHYAKNLGVFGLNIPSVVTMYDMTTLIHPELFPKLDVWYWKTIEKITLQRASRVIAISKTTASDLEHFYHLPSRQIAVIYPSIDERFKPAPPGLVRSTRERYHLPDSYILHVGRIDLKKNLTLLVEAFAQARKSSKACQEDRLVLIGEVYSKSQDEVLLPTIERLELKEDVIFLGSIADADLPSLISGAKTAVSASIHEGFGLAAVEALACGTPLVAYKAGALQEAVGEAALLIDQLNQETLAKALITISEEADLRQELRLKGLVRAQMFQGERNARQTLELYEELVNENKRTSTTYPG